ncbi:hypothetical protein CK203_029948 [Vitis vinifera]|uniref:Transposon Ty3-I Gag-Pol polyprotein n=1 Tax=Vitis vinifera TaxID=29760 RepID=A0A438IK98_VITVI|nr:hypothetical protein CK203_029948 [Vitis vinifera]
MTQEETQSMQKILRSNHDIFAWTHSDMKGIHPSIASHKLNIFPAARPVRQKIRRFHPDRQKVIQNEIDKLLGAGFIREFSLTADRSNVDSTSGQGMLSFLDAFSGYHQIPMSPDDEEKQHSNAARPLLLQVMPFGLKNAGATYQRLMTKIFKPLIGRSVEVYIDDIVVKAKLESSISSIYRKFFISYESKLVALGRFIARFTEELRPFFLAIRKAGAQGWTDSCQSAFEKIKHYLKQPPILSSPIPKEKLYMYLAVSEWAISAVLFRCPHQGAETCLLCQQGIGRCRNQVFKNGANSLSSSKCCPKAPPLFSSPPSDFPNWEHLEQAIRLGYSASNNEAEYEAILSGLDLALALSVSKLRIYSDSQLVVRHVQKDMRLRTHVWRDTWPKKIPLATPLRQPKRIIKNGRMILQNISGQALYPKILNKRTKSGCRLPASPLIGGHLYKRSFTGPYLRCLGHSEAQYVLAELHEGICGIIREDDPST